MMADFFFVFAAEGVGGVVLVLATYRLEGGKLLSENKFIAFVTGDGSFPAALRGPSKLYTVLIH